MKNNNDCRKSDNRYCQKTGRAIHTKRPAECGALWYEKHIRRFSCCAFSYGKYKLNEDLKYDFLYEPSEFMLSLNRHIKEKFPFIDYCIWQPSIFASMMLHIPAVRTTLVDVERVAMESVFMSLQNMESAIPVFLNPNQEDADRYITNRDMIIVRPLVKEAPIDIIDGCPVPTLEKMLVDAISDKELQHLQGNELYTIYSNAFSDYEIKMPRLLRYAARRNRKQKVEQIINTINI